MDTIYTTLYGSCRRGYISFIEYVNFVFYLCAIQPSYAAKKNAILILISHCAVTFANQNTCQVTKKFSVLVDFFFFFLSSK